MNVLEVMEPDAVVVCTRQLHIKLTLWLDDLNALVSECLTIAINHLVNHVPVIV